MVDLLFNICQASLSIAGIVAITITFITDTMPYWLDLVIRCTLQLIAGANVSVILYARLVYNLILRVAHLDDSWHQRFAPSYMASLW